MPTICAVGQSFALEGREACIQAIEQARQKILHEADHIVLAFVFASREYDLQSVLSGASAQLRNTPLFGFSAEGQLTADGQHLRSVVVALLAGSDLSVQANWWPDFSHDSHRTTLQMIEYFGLESVQEQTTLLVNVDGFHGDSETLCKLLPPANIFTLGCLTGGNDRQKLAYQIGGLAGGDQGLAAAIIQGGIKVGVGIAHGWQPIGKYFQVTHAEDLWVRKLDGRSAAEAYAEILGQKPREWAFPPLNSLIRLYPLGLENDGGPPFTIRSPLFVEVDGSFRMNSHVNKGATGHLLVGSTGACLQAVREASQQALDSLGAARPILALVFADIAWRMLFENQPGSEVGPIREVIGPDVPISGGHTIGQIVTTPSGPEVLNQHIEIILFGAVD